MGDNSVGIRLAVDAADGKKALVDFADTGDAQAKRLVRSYDQAADDMIAADRRRAQAAAKISALMPQTPVQQIYQAGASTNFGGESARDSAAAMKELLAAQEDLTQRAAALKAKLDPLAGAQSTYNAAIKNADELLAAHLISEGEHEKAVGDSTRTLNAAKKELGEHSAALGLNRQQFIIGQSAVMRFSDSVLAGNSPIKAAALEAHKLGEVLSVDDNGVAGGLAKVKAIATPTNLAIAAGAVVAAAAAVAWYEYSSAVGKLNALAQGSGRVLGESGSQLEANALAAAEAGHTTVSAARDIEAGYLSVAKSGDVLVGLTAITKDFAAATGQDVTAATSQLAAAFGEPIQGAADLAEKYGLLTRAQEERIAKLIEEGKQEEAQKLLMAQLKGEIAGAAEQADGLAGAVGRIGAKFDNAFNSAGRFFNTYGKGIVNAGLEAFQLPTLDDFAGAAPKVTAGSRQNAAANQARARALSLSDSYRGDTTDQYQRAAGTLRTGIAAGGTPEQIAQMTTALAANEHALQTWVPAQQKANDVAVAQAKLAAARGPAQKAAAERALVLAQAQGTVATSADIAAQAHARADAAAAHATKTGDKHAQTLAREAESMEVSAKAAIGVADAYLTSSDAGVTAEARRKAATDATKKGIDVDEQARRQLALAAAEEIMNAAKKVAGMNDESGAREAVLAKVKDGTLAAGEMDIALQKEAALRPLLAARARLHGDALDTLNKVIDATTLSIDRSAVSAAKFDFAKQIEHSRLAVIELKAQIDDLGHTPLDQALNAANRSAMNDADAKDLPVDDPQRLQLSRSREGEAQGGYERDRAKYVADLVKNQQDALELSQREAALAGASDSVRTAELDKLRLEQDIRRRFPDLSAADTQQLLRGVQAIDAANAKAKLLADSWSEIRSAGDQFLSDLTSPDGSGIKRLLGDIEQEFIKLAALNPLKNLLLKESNPTLGGVLGSLFKAGTSVASGVTDRSIDYDAIAASPRNASGTEYFSGGQTWLAENGPELVTLPTGSKVTPAPATRRMLAGNDNSGETHIHVYADGAVLSDTVKDWVRAGVEEAATRGAHGGAQLARANDVRRAARQIRR